MRYFVECAFLGTNYVGWQKQPNGISVQSVIEEKMSTFLRSDIEVTGCGRTDAGVHAPYYVFHFDHDDLPEDLLFRLNQMLPEDIAFRSVRQVSDDAHARYAAIERSYQYALTFIKDPFHLQTRCYYPQGDRLDFDLLDQACALLKEYQAFKPFCKTGSDTPHYLCDLREASWERSDTGATFTITANRFLRGMVRLIVGMMLNVGRGQLSWEEVKTALETQEPLPRADSAAAHGLHLTRVHYPADIYA